MSLKQSGFRPPWWCTNTHQQTVWRKYFGKSYSLALKRERWQTPDDDFLDLDFLEPAQKRESKKIPTILFLHGLEGSSQAKYILGMLRRVAEKGWRGAALNFRSCSGEINRQPRFYHSGETTDLNWVIQEFHRRWPASPLFLVGFSLGGSVLLKWLGENGSAAEGLIQAAVAISVPFDLGVAAQRIDTGFGRIYGQNFLPTLKQKILEKAALHPGLIDINLVRGITSYIEFEDKVFAPIHHFQSAADYWNRCSAKNFLEDISRSTLIIHAMDDPFLPGTHLPEILFKSKWLIPEISKKGGHAGFVEGAHPWAVSYWTESRTILFLSSFL